MRLGAAPKKRKNSLFLAINREFAAQLARGQAWGQRWAGGPSGAAIRSCFAEARLQEALRQGRLSNDRFLAIARHLQRSSVEQGFLAALAVDRIADHRRAERFGGVDPDLVGTASLGSEFNEGAAVL